MQDVRGNGLESAVRTPAIVAVVVGFTLWFLAALVSGRREPWDATFYWAVAYPIALATCAWLGHRYPERPVLWPLLLFESQFVAMCLRNGEVGNLWPLGLALFAVLALPGIAVAKLAARRAARSAA